GARSARPRRPRQAFFPDRTHRNPRRRVLSPSGRGCRAPVPLPLEGGCAGRSRALSRKGRRAAPPARGALRDFEIPALPQSSPTSLSEGGRPGVTARGQRWASLVALALAFAGLYLRAPTAPSPGG